MILNTISLHRIKNIQIEKVHHEQSATCHEFYVIKIHATNESGDTHEVVFFSKHDIDTVEATK